MATVVNVQASSAGLGTELDLLYVPEIKTLIKVILILFEMAAVSLNTRIVLLYCFERMTSRVRIC